MSGDQDFFSFVNLMTSALTGSGLNIVVGKDPSPADPFLRFSIGPSEVINNWVNQTFCQAWLVVSKQATEPLERTLARYTELVKAASRDVGLAAKTDYSGASPASVGGYQVKITEITPDMSSDPLRAKRVITWILTSSGR